jgi:hypothetical protein
VFAIPSCSMCEANLATEHPQPKLKWTLPALAAGLKNTWKMLQLKIDILHISQATMHNYLLICYFR